MASTESVTATLEMLNKFLYKSRAPNCTEMAREMSKVRENLRRRNKLRVDQYVRQWAGSSVGITTELRAGRSGDRISVGPDFPPVQTGT